MLTRQKIAEIKRLHQKKHRDAERKFIVEGWKNIEEAVTAGWEIDTIVYDAQKIENPKYLSALQRASRELFPAKSKELESISETVTSQGIIAVVPKPSEADRIETILHQHQMLIVVLDGITDPGNLGTIIRTCDWFGVNALVIGKNSVELYNPKVVRAAMGSLFHFPIIEETDLNNFLLTCRKEKISVYSTELTKSEDIRTVTFSQKTAIIIGSESHGVSAEVSSFADKKILIPHFGKAESLNAAMACGIILSRIRL